MLRQETTELGEKSAHPGVTESTNTDATRTLEKEMLAPEDASGRSWRQRVGKVEPYQLVFIYPLSLQLQTSLEKASVVILESAGMRGILGGLASAGYSPKVEASASWAASTVPCGPRHRHSISPPRGANASAGSLRGGCTPHTENPSLATENGTAHFVRKALSSLVLQQSRASVRAGPRGGISLTVRVCSEVVVHFSFCFTNWIMPVGLFQNMVFLDIAWIFRLSFSHWVCFLWKRYTLCCQVHVHRVGESLLRFNICGIYRDISPFVLEFSTFSLFPVFQSHWRRIIFKLF